MARSRLNSEINGNFRKIENFSDHFVKHQKWQPIDKFLVLK